MRRFLFALFPLMLFAVLAVSCGGDDGDLGQLLEAAAEAGAANAEEDLFTPIDPSVVTPEAPGDLAINSIRIGDQVWMRTLPMTRGQCFVVDETDTLPASSNIWGTLDGDDDTTFSVGMNQSGDFSLLVDNQSTFYWNANSQIEGNIIEITHDFDTLTSTGKGVFANAFTGERAEGSFILQCEPTQN